jgi:transitional endoplasmic reticulum ATPase
MELAEDPSSLPDAVAAMRIADSPPPPGPSPTVPRVDDALLGKAIGQLRAAIASGQRGVLVTGGDAFSRRAVVARGTHGTTALAVGAVDDAVAVARVRVLLDAPSPSPSPSPSPPTLVAVAAQEHAAPPALRRAGRLESIVRLGPPTFAARVEAWTCVLRALCVGDGDGGALARRLAAASPAFGLGDLRRVVYSAISEAGGEARVAPDRLLALVRAARPEAAARLDFVTYGSGCAGLGDGRAPASGWRGVGGYENVKTLMERLVEWPVTRAETFARLGVDAPRGILLHGPSGCGKSLLVGALLAKLHTANWMRVDGPALFSRYLGDSEARVRQVFAQARALEPCIVFIDDLEALAGSRGAGDESGVERRVLGALLAELDGAAAGRVFVLACANELRHVDAALVRSGRIDNVVHVGRPDAKDREAILRLLTAGMSVENDDGGDVVRQLAQDTPGYTGADLARLSRDAAMQAIRRCGAPECVLWRDFDAALRRYGAR